MHIGFYCSVDHDLIYPCEYNEEVLHEMLDDSVISLKQIDWDKASENVGKDETKDIRKVPTFKKSWDQKKEGDKTEKLFIDKCKLNNLNYRCASLQEDYYDHVDVIIENKDKNEIKIDIKGLKSLRRNGPKQNKYFFVELHSEGWLISGKSHYIAIQFSDKLFLIFDKYLLFEYANKNVKWNLPVVAWPEQSFERVYVRKGTVTTVLTLLNTVEAYLYAGIGTF